jgi:hypothetical protein
MHLGTSAGPLGGCARLLGHCVLCGADSVLSVLLPVPPLTVLLRPSEDRAHVDQILAVVTDAVAEGRLAFHPKDFYKSHKIQVGGQELCPGGGQE